MYTETYSEMRNNTARNQLNETNDCGVIATAIVTNRSYKDAWMALQRNGRKPRSGSPFFAINVAVTQLNGKIEGDLYRGPVTNRGVKFYGYQNQTVGIYNYIRKPDGGQYTTKTIGKVLPKGRYLVYSSGHVSALIDGEIHDWANGRAKRVNFVTKVELNGSETPVVTPAPAPAPEKKTTTGRKTRRDGKGQYTRNHVIANGVEYRSVKQAFEALGLPLAKHIKFRAQLKMAGVATFQGVQFRIV